MNQIADLIFPWVPLVAGLFLAWSAYSLWRASRSHSALFALVLFAVFAAGSGLMSAFPATYSLRPGGGAYTGVLPEGTHGSVIPALNLAFLVGAGSLGFAAARFSKGRA